MAGHKVSWGFTAPFWHGLQTNCFNIGKKSKINTWKILCVLWMCSDKIYLEELEQIEIKTALPLLFFILILKMLTLHVHN